MTIEAKGHVPTLEGQLKRTPRRRYQSLLRMVERWKHTTAPDGYTETLLEHVRGINEMVDELSGHPALRSQLNLSRLNIIVGVHDLGEVGTGDIDRADPHYETLKAQQEQAEYEYFMHNILPNLPYTFSFMRRLRDRFPRLRSHVEDIARAGYQAYESLSDVRTVKISEDREALVAKILDRVDAVNKGVRHFHVGKTNEAKESAVLVELAGANQASSLHLYRLLEVLGDSGQVAAMQELGAFILGRKEEWDRFDTRIFDTGRQVVDEIPEPYNKKLPSFAEVMREISQRYSIRLIDSLGTDVPMHAAGQSTIKEFMQQATNDQLPRSI